MILLNAIYNAHSVILCIYNVVRINWGIKVEWLIPLVDKRVGNSINSSMHKVSDGTLIDARQDTYSLPFVTSMAGVPVA